VAPDRHGGLAPPQPPLLATDPRPATNAAFAVRRALGPPPARAAEHPHRGER
ncbi:unnamed protein product, partial [Prorocentrum cordatum]